MIMCLNRRCSGRVLWGRRLWAATARWVCPTCGSPTSGTLTLLYLRGLKESMPGRFHFLSIWYVLCVVHDVSRCLERMSGNVNGTFKTNGVLILTGIKSLLHAGA